MKLDPLSWWQSKISEIAPAGHVLRRFLADNWVRFHSLPESKRYPETESEYLELLRRHSEVANELFSPNEPIFIFRSYLKEQKLRGKQKHQLAGRQLLESMIKLPANLGVLIESDDDLYCVRAMITVWKPEFFDVLIRQVSNEEQTGVTFVSPATKNIYCPYDGGMDIFSFSVNRAVLEAKFLDWQSTRSDKL
jgi:hypothetical protein